MGAQGLLERRGPHWPRLAGVEVDPFFTPENCGLDYWLREVAQGMLAGLCCGHDPALPVARFVREPGPLREAILREFAYRHMAEDLATRALGCIVRDCPTMATLDFYATQLLDEARHAAVFRGHLAELGLPEASLLDEIAAIVGPTAESVLVPIKEFGWRIIDAHDFMGSVLVLTVIAEGVLAPAAEMSEYKWQVFDPAASQICLGVNIDETRHLAVGTEIIRHHLREHPGERPRLRAIVRDGLALIESLPMTEVLVERESLFQQGVEKHRDALGACELVPGLPLADTSASQRLAMQQAWCASVQADRLAYMGLADPEPLR
jgi:hypothetical protein